MKNEMEEIDKLIKDTLSEEEAKFYDVLDEQNIFEMLFGLFRGKNAWVNILLNIMTLVFFVLFIYSGFQFFSAETTSGLLKWGFGSLIFILCVSMLKLYAWMQMDKYAILREMKRLELQVMSLSSKVQNP
ncbi:MAG: DUF6768 family protein [Bacteroidota bacterium]